MNKRRYSMSELFGTVSSMHEKMLLLHEGIAEANAVTYWMRVKAEAERIADEAAQRIADLEKEAH